MKPGDPSYFIKQPTLQERLQTVHPRAQWACSMPSVQCWTWHLLTKISENQALAVSWPYKLMPESPRNSKDRRQLRGEEERRAWDHMLCIDNRRAGTLVSTTWRRWWLLEHSYSSEATKEHGSSLKGAPTFPWWLRVIWTLQQSAYKTLTTRKMSEIDYNCLT